MFRSSPVSFSGQLLLRNTPSILHVVFFTDIRHSRWQMHSIAFRMAVSVDAEPAAFLSTGSYLRNRGARSGRRCCAEKRQRKNDRFESGCICPRFAMTAFAQSVEATSLQLCLYVNAPKTGTARAAAGPPQRIKPCYYLSVFNRSVGHHCLCSMGIYHWLDFQQF